MHGYMANVKRFYSSLQDHVPFRRRKEMKRQVVISHPFNFKKEASIVPGFTENEISVLREKAAASRLGIADNLYVSSSSSLSHDRSPSPSPSPSPPPSLSLNHSSSTAHVHMQMHYNKYATLPHTYAAPASTRPTMRRRSGSVSVLSIPTMGMGMGSHRSGGMSAASFPGCAGGREVQLQLHVPSSMSSGGVSTGGSCNGVSGSGSTPQVATPVSMNGKGPNGGHGGHAVDLDSCLLSPLARSPVGVHGHSHSHGYSSGRGGGRSRSA